MLKIPNGNLPAQAGTLLDQYQADVDGSGDYATCVAAAKSMFKSRNRATNPAFSEVRATLTEMCSGIGRCMYCEDAPADEVEHHRPKDLYPELVFVWRNYLYACGPCNGPKNNRFAVIDQTTQQLVNVSRQKKAPVVPPAPGAPALLDPRQEDPLDFLMLDLRDTFYLTPLYAPGTVEFLRADYTLEVLRLNARDGLVEARESAFGGYRARLCEFIQQRDAGAGSLYLAGLTAGFRSSPHATVWSEMKRQHGQLPELVDLFRQAPEALEF